MMTLLNMCAFLIFLLYPTMPPRFLPPTFGFVDTVNAEDAQSVWMSGHYVNKLAAMPSMHFGYAFAIGCVFVYESGLLQQLLSCGKIRFGRGHNQSNADRDQPSLLYEKPMVSRCFFFVFGMFYPCWILLTIVATANHYFLDAAVAILCVLVAFLCNRVLLIFRPLEEWLLWALRMEKPWPTTGWRRRQYQLANGGSRLVVCMQEQEPTMASRWVPRCVILSFLTVMLMDVIALHLAKYLFLSCAGAGAGLLVVSFL